MLAQLVTSCSPAVMTSNFHPVIDFRFSHLLNILLFLLLFSVNPLYQFVWSGHQQSGIHSTRKNGESLHTYILMLPNIIVLSIQVCLLNAYNPLNLRYYTSPSTKVNHHCLEPSKVIFLDLPSLLLSITRTFLSKLAK